MNSTTSVQKHDKSAPVGKRLRITVGVVLVQEGSYYTAICPSLSLSSFSTTKEGAKLMFREALDLFIEDITHRNTLEIALLELGWTLRKIPKAQYEPPAEVLDNLDLPAVITDRYHVSFSIPV